MKGKVLHFDEQSKIGQITGDDGNRYTFTAEEWKQATPPRVGCSIDFINEEDTAKEIYISAPMSAGASKKIAAALFAFFLGAFGAHKFYLGYKKEGIIMLLVFLFGWILLGIPSAIIGFIALIEFILYLTKSDDEFEQIYVIGRKPWF